MDHSDLFRVEKWALHLCGLSIFENNGLGYQVYTVVTIAVFIFGYNGILLLDVVKQDFKNGLESWMYFFAYAMIAVNVIILLPKRKSVGILLAELQHNFLVNDATKKWHASKNRQILAFVICASLSIASQLIHSLVLRFSKKDPQEWRLSYGSISTINITYSPNFEIAYAYQSSSVTFGTICGVTITVVIVSVLQFFAVQFRVLQNSAKSLCAEEVKSFVDYHVCLLETIQKFGSTFDNTVFSIFFWSFGMVCLEIFRLSQVRLNDLRTLSLLSEVLVISAWIFLICFSAEQIEVEREKLAHTVYELDIVGAEMHFKKCVVIILQHTQAPCRIKVKKQIEISLTTFSEIMRAAYSSYTILNTLMEK